MGVVAAADSPCAAAADDKSGAENGDGVHDSDSDAGADDDDNGGVDGNVVASMDRHCPCLLQPPRELRMCLHGCACVEPA